MGVAVCMRSPEAMGRVAKTARPTDSVSATRMGGGGDEVVVENEE